MRRQISKSLLAFFLALPFANLSFSEIDTASSAVQVTQETFSYANDYRAAKKLHQALRNGDRRAVAALILYPLMRETPLNSIKNGKDFLKHWEEYFDSISTKAVLAASAEQFGWRGIALKDGMVWFNNGRIISINTQTAANQKALQAAKKQDNNRLYTSARDYDKITFQCRTKRLFIRVQQHGDDLRYFAWKNGADLLAKPELELRGGTYDAQGSGGNFDLEFKNDSFTYSLNVGHNLCGEDRNDHLVILEGSKIQSSEVCTEVKS